MSIPGFGAEASLATFRGQYRMSSTEPAHAQFLVVAYLDQHCYQSCYGDCVANCFSLPGSSKAACIADCREQARECRAACTRPDPYPTPWVCEGDRCCRYISPDLIECTERPLTG